MFSRSELRAAALVGGLALIGFGFWRSRQKASQPAQGPLVVAVLPFANLGADPSLDWVGDAAQMTMCLRTDSLTRVRAFPVRTAGEAASRGALRLVHGSYQGTAERMAFTLEVEDLPRREMMRGSPAVPPQALLPALELVSTAAAALAAGETPEPFPTRSLDALRAFTLRNFEEAVQADPGFSHAWRAWVEASAASQNAPVLKQALDRGEAAAPRFAPLERLRWDALAARVTGNLARLASAAEGLAKTQPSNAGLQAQAAAAAVQARRLEQGIAFYEAALALDRSQTEYWNNLGYAYAYAGKLDKAVEALRTYVSLAPQSANASDSLGEVYLRAGKFAEAAQHFEQANSKEPGFQRGYALYKAAVARQWMGDANGARDVLERYLKGLDATAAELERADWLYFTGQADEARALLRKAAGSMPQLQAAVQRRLALDDLAKLPAAPPVDLFQALWLTARGEYAAAEPLWRKVQTATGPGDDDLSREMLLKCLLKQGKKTEAAPLAAIYPLPRGPGQVLNNPSVLALAVENRRK